MKLDNATFLISGANRGIGLAFTKAFDALEAGADEVLADEMTQQVRQSLSAQPGVYLQVRN